MHARSYAARLGAALLSATPAAALAQAFDPALEPERPRLLDTAPTSPASERRARWDPAIAPAAGLGVHLYLSDDSIEKPGFGFWAGANLYARRAQVAPLITPRIIVELNPDIRGEPTDVLIGARLGAAWMQRPYDSFWTHLTPNLIGYAHAAARLPRGERAARLRLGLGAAIPRFAPASALMTLLGVPLPTAVEISYESGGEARADDWLLHLSMSL